MTSVKDNLRRVQDSIAQACAAAGRDPSEITLVCVSKKQPASLVIQAIEAGATDIGENYVQEAKEKFGQIGPGVKRHLIGHLQSNKARLAVDLFDVIQTVDSIALARRLSRIAVEAGTLLDVLIEVNIGGELTKSGIDPACVSDLAGQVAGLPGLRLTGLMGIPPLAVSPGEARPYFSALRDIFLRLPEENRHTLSMGMSGDFAEAIAEGSTMVRVGTAIFGPRG